MIYHGLYFIRQVLLSKRKNVLFGEIPDSALSLLSINFYDVDLLAFGFGILNGVPSPARLLTIPNGKHLCVCAGVCERERLYRLRQDSRSVYTRLLGQNR